MLDATHGYTTTDGREIRCGLMEMRTVTVRFGGVTAIKDIPSNRGSRETCSMTARRSSGRGWDLTGGDGRPGASIATSTFKSASAIDADIRRGEAAV